MFSEEYSLGQEDLELTQDLLFEILHGPFYWKDEIHLQRTLWMVCIFSQFGVFINQ